VWANSHQDEAAGLLSTSTGLDKAIWLKTLASTTCFAVSG
jgi:sulfonate transport system substrate-binding protein